MSQQKGNPIMGWFSEPANKVSGGRTAADVAAVQAAKIQKDTGKQRAARAAGADRRSIGTRRVIVPPATGRPQQVGARTYNSGRAATR